MPRPANSTRAAAAARYFPFPDFAAGLAEGWVAAVPLPWVESNSGWPGYGMVSDVAATVGVRDAISGVTSSTCGVMVSTNGVTNSARGATGTGGGLRPGACAGGFWALPAANGRAPGTGVGEGEGVLGSRTRRSAAYSLMVLARVSSPLRCKT